MREFAEGQDVIMATEVAQAMGMNPWEIAVDNEKAAKFKEITDYFAPFTDKTYILSKLTRGMQKEQAVDHVFRYVTLRKEYNGAKERFESLGKELTRYER